MPLYHSMLGLNQYGGLHETFSMSMLPFGNALRLDGLNDRVTFTQIEIGTSTDYTMQFWFNPSNISSNRQIINGSGSSRFIKLLYGSSRIQVKHSSATNNYDTPTFATGTWVHMLISTISESMRVYINAVESTTGALSMIPAQNYSSISTVTASQDYAGDIDEFALLVGTGATPSQVTSLYNGGNKSDFIAIMGDADIYLEMDQSGTDTIATDTSTNSNDGTLNDFSFSPSPWVLHV